MEFDNNSETVTPTSLTTLTIGSTGGVIVSSGTTAQRSGSPTNGTVRYNTTLDCPETYFQGEWSPTFMAGGAGYGMKWDDLITDAVTTNSWENTFSGTGATNTSVNTGVNSTDRAIGVQALTTGTTTTGRAALGSSTVSTIFGYAYHYLEFRIMIPTLSTSGDEYDVIAGWTDSQGVTGNGTDGIFFQYDRNTSVNWLIRTKAGGTQSSTTTTTAITAGAWVKLGIEVNETGTSVNYFINGTNVGTIATNIPTGATQQSGLGFKIEKSAGTNARLLNMDYIKYFYTYTTAR